MSQHRRLTHVCDPEARKALAELAVPGHWTVTDLEQAIEAGKIQHPADAPHRGRPPLPISVKRFGSVQRAIAKLTTDAVADLGGDETEDLIARAEAAPTALSTWIDSLRAQLPT